MDPQLGPRCPGCGYEIFGLRDMRCPECGRALDVRDFSLGEAGAERRRTKVFRDGVIGGLIAAFILLILVVGMGLLTGFAFKARVMPLGCGGIFLLGLALLAVVMREVGRDARYLRKRKK